MPTATRLSHVVGACIDGLDASKPLSAQQQLWLSDALHQHGFIVLKKQSLSPSELVRFAQYWGEPSPHVIDTFHHPQDPRVLILSNVVKDGRATGLADAGTYFHTDYSYLAVPARCTILHALDMPSGGNGTTFANQAAAYDDLSALRKKQIADLVVRHHYGNRDDLNHKSRTVASVLTAEQAGRVTWVHHPLVKKHPFTGRRALYAVSGSSFGIEGMDDAEALALLRELSAHSTQAHYRHTHDYDNGDLIVWDNSLLLHAAPLVDLSRPRTLWRVTVLEGQASSLSQAAQAKKCP
ncbi:MAG: TauD/TfdA family dioxygenase [Rhodoferax sp.]|nr:TauD/TfdA family dioxygenase [Rhodoferax sp.]